MVNIDYGKNKLLTEFGRKTLESKYSLPGEDPQETFARAATAYADNEEHAQRLYEYVSKLWFMFATPVISNAGTDRGLPISCFLNYVDDSREGLIDHFAENVWLSSYGGGIGAYWGRVRADGSKTSTGNVSSGTIPFLKVHDSQVLAYQQGTQRRGAYAAYMDVNHPEIIEFIELRNPTGDKNRRTPNLHLGVCISGMFMHAVKNDDTWDLVDPNSLQIVKTMKARDIWEKILETRAGPAGEPYLFFKDTANRALHPSLKERRLYINASNLCTEIMLPTNEDRTAVCCLSSVNLATYDEWKDNEQFIPDLIRMLNNVLDDFIERGDDKIAKAVESARRERSIGLGAMGWHTLLQKWNVPFESAVAIGLLNKIHSTIKEQAVTTSRQLAVERGEPEDLKGSGDYNAHLIAIAPNATTSIVCGEVSPSIEPRTANAYTIKTDIGVTLHRNRELFKYIPEDDVETWKSIVDHGGSVQHLDCLDDDIKAVFKTAFEIDQNWVIEQASHRQKHIDQGQSVNLFFPEAADKRYVNQVHMAAWEKGLKALYYYRSRALRRAENIGTKVKRQVFEDYDEKGNDECIACEG